MLYGTDKVFLVTCIDCYKTYWHNVQAYKGLCPSCEKAFGERMDDVSEGNSS